ncbi:uncharacterized protein [Linepithema humile]|uniref:uncharacterized protein isoform X3 n=1 Tax=Linepithema humile TaxID=83485 RepID=UPI00351EAA2C
MEQEEYDKKFAEMHKYIPFLKVMIARLQNVKDKDTCREVQLQKMESLLEILTTQKNRLKIETLQRCEDVLYKLYNKMGKGNMSTNTSCRELFPNNDDNNTAQSSTLPEDEESSQSKKAKESQNTEEPQNAEDDADIIEETPQSPDAAGSSSPDCQILPIEIPTERYNSSENHRQQAKQKVIPVITISDRPGNINTPVDFSDDVTFCEWDMLEESETHNARSRGDRQPTLAPDVSTAARLVSSNLPQKTSDSRSYALDSRNIPTVPVPSLGGSRRLTSVLEKNRLNLSIITGNIARPESPVNVPEVRLNSPDPEILFARSSSSVTPSKSKDSHSASKPPSIPLLLSPPPPPVSSVPPLSMEDLAELLNDEGNAEKNKTGENAGRHTIHLPARKPTSNVAKSSDHRSPFPGPKPPEPRYADNYERHPRQRDAHSHEIARDKQVAGHSDEAPSQIPVFINASNKPDAPLYQRRSSMPPETRKEPAPLRQDSEFVIDGVDYYNMHVNPMHWSPSAVPSTDHQFANTQWASSVFPGMSNPPLQSPIQHPYQHPAMEPQFRPQFPTLPVGPRPLITPTPRSQDHMTPSGFPVAPQYRGFQMNQGPYDSAFSVDRPVDYPHVRPTWEAPANRVGQAPYESVIPCGIQDNSTSTPYTRPSTPCTWGGSRSNRGRGYYNNERNRSETRPGFNRDARRSDWSSRDGHSDRENPNRFPNRDPRVRPEHNATSPNQTKEASVSARDPRLAKDKHSSSKTKDAPHNERDPRKRPTTTTTATTTTVTPTTATTTTAATTTTTTTTTTLKEKSKSSSQKLSEKEKADKINSLKDRLQSQLNGRNLYGAVDATQSSGLQNFKIPKIKRCEPQPLRPISEIKKAENTLLKSSRAKSVNKKKKSNRSRSESKSKDDASSEVSSSSDGSKSATKHSVQSKQQDEVAKKGENPPVVEVDRNVVKIGEADSVTDDPKSNDVAEKSKKDELEADGSKPNENLTQEWIESLIRKSFESGEGKKLVEEAKLIQKLLKEEKFKKLKKIIESDSSECSDKDEARKTPKKKRRIIVSDSSEDESLADRLEVLNTGNDANNEGIEPVSAVSTDSKGSEERVEATVSNDVTAKKDDCLLKTSGKERDVQVDKNDQDKNLHLQKESEKNQDDNEKIDDQAEGDKQTDTRLESSGKEKKRAEDKHDETSAEKQRKDNAEMPTSQNENQIEGVESATSNAANDQPDENSTDKPKMKIKPKRRNSLEMLQEDIREMFISDDVVTATGFRMCRLKETQSAPSSSSKKDETSNAAEKKAAEPSAETHESAASKSKKSLRSRAAGESSKSKSKSKKDVKRPLRSLRSKELVPNSDTEEDQPLALRTEKLLNIGSTPNQEEDHGDESILRRSKRVLHKDILKEPRVVMEKTDISKVDLSKGMFDSSSDESFSIDVAELAAAVDVSLRPEKNSDQDSVDTMASLKRKNKGKRMSKGSKKSRLNEDKSEDGMYLTDEDSMISDISMSSSTTARKRTSGGAARTCAREDLLSNILVGLVPTATMNTSTDKGSDADVDEDMNDPLAITETSVKKPTKRKKKKPSWQMGIVTTKKKKKKAASAVKSAQANIDESTNVETSISTNNDSNDNSATTEETFMENPADSLSLNDAVVKLEPIQIKCEDIKPLIKTDNTDIEDYKELNDLALSELLNTEEEGNLNDSLLSIDDGKPLIPEEMESTTVPESAAVVASSAAVAASSPAVAASSAAVAAPSEAVATTADETVEKQPPKILYDEQMEEAFRKMDAERLMNYAFDGTCQNKYKCLLCLYSGKNIVHHYKMNHPGKEVLISRFKLVNALAAMAIAVPATETTVASQVCKFRCRFCYFVTEGAADVALEAFYEHCTTHTGEYRFHCNKCSYQAVAKASMKTHYYKICRKPTDTFNNVVTEDALPKENGVYGYLCRKCNYVQLKRANVAAHVAFWHRNKANNEILKINMSLAVPVAHAARSSEKSTESTSANDSFFFEETKPEISELENIVRNDEPMPTVAERMSKSQGDNNISEESILCQPKPEENIEIKEETTDLDKSREFQGEPEGSVSTGNLSVFVCPPELENKDDEIQRERQKKMQEIADNIGILKNQSKPGLSIIDKLQNKMRTDVVVSSPTECNASADIPEAQENLSLPLVTSSKPNGQETPSLSTELLIVDKPEMANETDGQVDTKIRDPLAIMDSSKDDVESDDEASDRERSAPIFDTDSSSEQSDAEPADVNKILKETSSMNALSSMATTIQRLAAQLQNAKPLEPATEPANIDVTPQTKTGPEIKTDSDLSISKTPDVVSYVKHLLSKQQNVGTLQESSMAYNDANQSMNFLRFRRLSGDKLSLSSQNNQNNMPDKIQPDTAIDAPQTDTEEECSFLKIENVVSLAANSENNETAVENPIVNDIRKAVETSPTKNKGISIIKKPKQPLILKKINVLAPMPTASITPIATSDHVTLIPMKDLPASISKSTTHLVTNFSTIPATVSPTTLPVTVSSVSPSNVNYKVVKVLCTNPTRGSSSIFSTKSKDVAIPTAVVKLKSVIAYASMLTDEKLACFYKCMGRDCDFASDSLAVYSEHYNFHEKETKKLKTVPPYDFQKCAYCCISMKSWTYMEAHLWERHSHCRYQCAYCFYRAVAKSYVQQHQVTCHPGRKYSIIIGKLLKPIQKDEEINRNTNIKPFVCTYEGCGKFFYVLKTFMMHLKTRHPTSHPMYSCHVCTTSFATIELLIPHYKRHGFSIFQCLYCIFGTETLIEMHQHLSVAHCNRLPQSLERSLPSMPTIEKPVVEQLLLRNFDDFIKLDETTLVNVDETAKSAQDAKNDQIPPIMSPNAEAALNKEQLKSPSNLLPNILMKHSKDTCPVNVTENMSNSATEKQTETKVLQSLGLQQKEKAKNHVRKQTFHKSELLSCTDDSGTKDSLESSSEINYDDEFVNTNLLDNPEFFKNLISLAGNTFKSNAVSANKTEDSDIEILDIESDKGNGEDDADQAAELSEENAEVKKQFAPCGVVEDKSAFCPEEAAARTAQLEEPLTLDDIKDTGYSGCELYKCGYLECSYTALNSNTLKEHIKECSFAESSKNLFCAHCKKRFVKAGFLLEHLMKAHGLKRFGCSLCEMRYAVAYQATAHMKVKHKCNNTKLVPADPTNPSVDGLFIVQAVAFGVIERKNKKRKGGKSDMEQENDKDNEKLSFSPDEIEKLPRRAIYNREVHCAVCPYTTKVRTNIVRHLQLHAKDETVPETGPVNPVPCLDKKEKMFDKMVNLASSSHQNGRMGAKSKETVKEIEEDDSIPKFVPEHKRYVCSVTECNYLTVDEAMLRYHLKALHSEEPYFRCPHCPPPPPGQESQNIAIDKMGVHLKMHDTRLYKCSHCNHHHYHSIEMPSRHVVERHLTDKHSEKRPFVKVVRELESTENVQQPVQEETEEEVPDPDGNHWKCNLCEYKCVYKADIAGHADTAHSENCQYKCTLCSFKTNGKILFEQHVSSKHANDSNADYTAVYRRIKGVNKRNAEVAEQGVQEEPFDTTPLWRRSMPRIRHIRGILLEEEEEQEKREAETLATSEASPVPPKVSSKRKSETDISKIPAKIKSTGKSISLDENNKQSKEKSKRSLSCEKLPGEAGETTEKQVAKEGAQSKANKKSTEHSKAIELSDVNDSDIGRFGPYGKPEGNMYVCTLCPSNQDSPSKPFKTKYKHDMRDHLYRELNYARWHCKTCGYLSVNRNALMQHFGKRHSGESADHEPLSPDNAIEDWVTTLLSKQTEIIKATIKQMNLASKNANTSVGTSSSNVNNANSPIKIQPDKRTVNLSSAISNLQSDILQDTNRSIDSDDGDDLVIDIKDDESFEKSSGSEDKSEKWFNVSEASEKNLEAISCKHCKTKCANLRGLKMHVQVAHLKRFGYLCFYCTWTNNSETLMRQHVRLEHPDQPEKFIHNPRAWGKPKLTNEFWEKEYGLDFSNPNLLLKSKKRKVEEMNDAGSSHRLYMREKCKVCGFVAMNYTGLKAHMRTHTGPKHSLKCSYCTYSCSFKPELQEHWEVNHSSLPFKFQERPSTAGSSSSETEKSPKKQKIDMIYEVEEVEEERVPVHQQASIVIYRCYYCNNRSPSLESVKRHWSLMHKESKSPEGTSHAKIVLPFRYSEIHLPFSKLPAKESAKNVESPRDFAKQSAESTSSAVQRHGWVCRWCHEFCETDNDRMAHHNMFHSHLPQNFTWEEQQQQQQQQQEEEEQQQQQKKEEEEKADQSKSTFIAALRLSARGAEKHADFVTESVPSFNSIVENLVKQSDIKIKSDLNQSGISSVSIPRGSRQPVAKKSTTKSTVSYTRPGPRVFKAVARKSTNPLPRYPMGIFMPHNVQTESQVEESKNEPVSYYGMPSSSVNLAKLNTYMVVGGHSMKVNCQTLAALININPKVLLTDIRKDP